MRASGKRLLSCIGLKDIKLLFLGKKWMNIGYFIHYNLNNIKVIYSRISFTIRVQRQDPKILKYFKMQSRSHSRADPVGEPHGRSRSRAPLSPREACAHVGYTPTEAALKCHLLKHSDGNGAFGSDQKLKTDLSLKLISVQRNTEIPHDEFYLRFL